jgi:UDP-GlcNAc:undecaprenyl-phosphate GlcNAc-1-phosphate transferase
MQKEFLIYLLLIVISVFFYFLIYYKKIKISHFLGTLDYPINKRQIHNSPTPKTAAYSIFCTLLLILIFNLMFNFFSKDLNIIILGSILIFFVGITDDIINLSPYNKIFFISIIIIFITYICPNILITKFYVDTYDTFYYLNKFSLIFTILCLLLLINASNLIDGINGLNIMVIFFWLFYLTQMFNSKFNMYIYLIQSILILSFFHNYSGKHFLGDAGSLMLSSFVGFLTIKFVNENLNTPRFSNSFEQLFLIFLIPGTDMLRLFVERIFKKKNPFIGDNNHLHHFLLKKNSLIKTLLIYLLLINFPIILTLYFKVKVIYGIMIGIFIYFFVLLYSRKN